MTRQPCQRLARNYGDMRTEIALIVLLAEYQGTRDSLQRIGERHGVNGRKGMTGCQRLVRQLGIQRPSVPSWRPGRGKDRFAWRAHELTREVRHWQAYDQAQTTAALVAGCTGQSVQMAAYYLTHEQSKERMRDSAAKRHARLGQTAEWKIRQAARNAIARIVRATGTPRPPKARTQEFLGCTYAQARAYLTPLLARGMTWENHGRVWEVDHVRPLASFDLTDPQQLLQACHYTNLQPLPCRENRQKGDKWEAQQ